MDAQEISMYELEATELCNCWAVKPKGQLGTCGFYPVAWVVAYVKARSAEEAIKKANTERF